MSILNPFRRKQTADVPSIQAASPENPSTSLSNPDLFWSLGYGTGVARFGEQVTEQSAMANSTVFRCVSILGGLVGSLPLRVYKDDPDEGRIEQPRHRLAERFSSSPLASGGPTAFNWKETLEQQVLLYGNSYAIIRYDQAARIIGFQPVLPWTVEIRVQSGKQTYLVNWQHQPKEIIPAEDMLHFVGMSIDGVSGLPRIRLAARDSISIARSIQTTTGAAFDAAIRPSMLITVPRDIAADAMRRVASFFTGEFGGQTNAGKPLFIQSDMTAQPLAVAMDDLLAVEAARYSVSEISRFFGIPLVLLNESNGVTAFGAGISELIRGLLRFTLDTELCRIEAELNRKLFNGSSFYVMFDRDQLLSTDPKSQAETTQVEINSGVLTIDEARRIRHRGKVAGGDTVMVNSAMVPLSKALEPTPAPVAPHAPQMPQPAQTPSEPVKEPMMP